MKEERWGTPLIIFLWCPFSPPKVLGFPSKATCLWPELRRYFCWELREEREAGRSITVGRVKHTPRGYERERSETHPHVTLPPFFPVCMLAISPSEYSASFLHYYWQKPQDPKLMNSGGKDCKMVPHDVENQSQSFDLFQQRALADIASCSCLTGIQITACVCAPGREGVWMSGSHHLGIVFCFLPLSLFSLPSLPLHHLSQLGQCPSCGQVRTASRWQWILNNRFNFFLFSVWKEAKRS